MLCGTAFCLDHFNGNVFTSTFWAIHFPHSRVYFCFFLFLSRPSATGLSFLAFRAGQLAGKGPEEGEMGCPNALEDLAGGGVIVDVGGQVAVLQELEPAGLVHNQAVCIGLPHDGLGASRRRLSRCRCAWYDPPGPGAEEDQLLSAVLGGQGG